MMTFSFFRFQFNAMLLVASLALIFSCTNLMADGITGKVITKNEADAKFGPVLTSVTVSAAEVQSWVAASGSYIMFNIVNGKVYVLTDNRVLVSPAGTVVPPTDLYHVYSTSVMSQLLSKREASVVTFEVRSSVFSVTNGNFTMEFGIPCPPLCD